MRELRLYITGTPVKTDQGNNLGGPALPIPVSEDDHPRGLYDKPVVRVPWFVYEHGSRRDIRTGDADSTDDIDLSIVAERLQDFGYGGGPVRASARIRFLRQSAIPASTKNTN